MSLKNPLKVVAKLEKHQKGVPLKDVSRCDPKLKRAKEILEREQNKAKKSRLECVLVQQYVAKYGSKNATSRLNGIIKTYVHNYLDSCSDELSNAALDTLEKKVRELAAEAKSEINTERSEKRGKSSEQRKLERIEKASMSMDSSQNFSRSAGSGVDLNNWSAVNTMLALKDKERAEADLRKAAEKKLRFKAVLDEQLKAQEARKIEAVEQKQRDLQYAIADVEDFKQEEAKKYQNAHSQVHHQRMLQMQQIEDNKKRLQREREERIAQEKRDMARAKRLAEDEQRLVMEKKEWVRINNERMKEENERNKLLKAQAKREQDEYEMKLNADYERKLAKEEQDRANAFANRMSKLIQSGKKFENSTGAEMKAENDRNTQRVMAEIAAKQAADEAREQQKREKRAAEIKKSTEFNRRLADEKVERKRAAEREAVAMRVQFEMDAKKLKEEEQMKKTEQLKKREELKGFLDNQVYVRASKQRNEQVLSEEEKQFNRTLIEKIQKDPEMYNKVTKAMNPAATPSYSSFAW